MGCIGWLAQSTRPDLTLSHSFLLAYNNKPSQSHMNVTLYMLHYIHSTIDYGFSFTSKVKTPLHTYMSFPHKSDTESYADAIPPRLSNHHRLTTYRHACWGSQIRNAIREGIHLPLFKFCSMSSAIFFRSGGPLTWKADRQDHTALSSCEAEIRATDMGSRLTINIRNILPPCRLWLPYQRYLFGYPRLQWQRRLRQMVPQFDIKRQSSHRAERECHL